ncbi:MAG: DUF502 domain-containing protein [Steroidobacteraceae bacterium]
MRLLGQLLLKGLITILPVGLTAYFMYWLSVTIETLLSRPLQAVLGSQHYWPGMGLLAGLALLLVVGVLVNAYLVQRLLGFGERLLLKVPVVKTVYSAIRDMTRLVDAGGKRDLERVVALRYGSARLIGFVTQDDARIEGIDLAEETVAVYLPMSYQIGGYTVYVPKSEIEPVAMPVEQAMRVVLTGGLQGR